MVRHVLFYETISAFGKRVGLLNKGISTPFAVGADDFFLRGFLGGFAVGLPENEIGVSGEKGQALAFEIGQGFKFVFDHEGQ